MSNLQHRQSKIQEHRKDTPFRQFLMEVASRWPINFYKHSNNISVLPPLPRSGNVTSLKNYRENGENTMESGYGDGDFLPEFQRLFVNHIKPSLIHLTPNENSDYCHCGFGAKSAYLTFVAGYNVENIVYSTQVWNNVTNAYNSSLVFNNSTNIYQSKMIVNSYNVFYSQYIYNSNNIRFCSSCIGCQYCIECHNLENKSYCIDNIQYTKEEFEIRQKQYHKQDYDTNHQQTLSQKSENFICSNSHGQGLYKCTDIAYGCNASNFSIGNNVVFSDGINGCSHFYDCMDTGTNSHHFYGICYGGEDSEHCYIGCYISHCNNVYYSYFMESCSFCLGCIGLKNQSYCIFNKQYTKEERTDKVNEIFGKMDEQGTLGDFFPASMNPFYFNDTAAYLIDSSFSKEEVTKAGYLRRDEAVKVDIPVGAILVSTAELEQYEGFDNEGNRTINADILKVTIQDEQGNYYRIIPMEYKFLVKHGLPLPRKHRLERMKENFKIS